LLPRRWGPKTHKGHDPVDDMEIIKSVQRGNSESFSLLVDKYHRHLLNFVYRLMGNDSMVEDIGQEIFLSVYRSVRSFDISRGIPFSAWLFITARNRCISEMRRKKRSAVSLEIIAGLASQAKSPEQAARDEERFLAIRAALEQLPEPYRETLIQSLRGDSPEEIARNARISPGTVKSRLSRARQKMKLLLHERFGGNAL
jgi:RNA polymerase sigma-70 factor (ECF subfamily)